MEIRRVNCVDSAAVEFFPEQPPYCGFLFRDAHGRPVEYSRPQSRHSLIVEVTNGVQLDLARFPTPT